MKATAGDETARDPAARIVETDRGRVRGDRRRGAHRFRGIPYAAPPVGARRFAPPAPPEPWTGVLDATHASPVAPQPPDMVSRLLGAGDGPPQSETDCLTVNVWTPAVDVAKRPVLVWIHGGAFVSGSGSVPWYDGANLARRDVVVVTVNYRLGALGFCHLEGLGGDAFAGSGNAGLLDQAAALGWVQRNIAAFGGDPGNVTIFGESAGGMSVGTHLALPASAGTFGRAIAQSGAVDNVSDPDRATMVATRLLDELGLDPRRVAELRSVPVAALIDAQQKVSAAFGITSGLPFQPVFGVDTLPVAPIDAIRSGSATGVDLLVGSNRDELRVFFAMNPAMRAEDDDAVIRGVTAVAGDRASGIVAAYRALLPGVSSTDLFETIGTDAVFRLPALRLADAQRTHAPVHVYEFHRVSTGLGGDMGATHAVDVPFTFDNLDAPGASFFTGEPDTAMRSVATTMADAWCSFARTGTPTASGLADWAVWEPPGHTTMILDTEPVVVQDPAGARTRIWSRSD